MKRIISVLVSIVLVSTLCLGMAFCVSADDPTYGTHDGGILTKPYQAGRIPPTEKFMNPDFEQGLMYWTGLGGKEPSSVVKLKEENGNKYISFTGQDNWDGIITPRFKIESAKVAQQLVLIYDWRGVSDFQIYLTQNRVKVDEISGIYEDDGSGFGTNSEIRLAQGSGTVLKEATNDEEWNTTMTYPRILTADPPAENPIMYFMAAVQVMTDPSVEADIDNLRLAIYRANEKKIYDLDGTTVLYDINALEEEELEEEEEEEEEYEEEEETEEEEDTSKEETHNSTDTDEAEDVEDTDSETSLFANPILWISVGAGVIVLAAAAIIVILILKKKKAAKPETTE